jgi:hypothetical protein
MAERQVDDVDVEGARFSMANSIAAITSLVRPAPVRSRTLRPIR